MLDTSLNVVLSQAQDLETTSEALSSLADSAVVSVQHEVAANPSTPEQALLRLALKDEYFIGIKLLQNPNVTVAVLDVLSRSAALGVQFGVVKHPCTSAETLTHLIASTDTRIAKLALEHPLCPWQLRLQVLAGQTLVDAVSA